MVGKRLSMESSNTASAVGQDAQQMEHVIFNQNDVPAIGLFVDDNRPPLHDDAGCRIVQGSVLNSILNAVVHASGRGVFFCLGGFRVGQRQIFANGINGPVVMGWTSQAP